jgi:hypothetical protein
MQKRQVSMRPQSMRAQVRVSVERGGGGGGMGGGGREAVTARIFRLFIPWYRAQEREGGKRVHPLGGSRGQ